MNRKAIEDTPKYIMESEGHYFRQLMNTAFTLSEHELERPIILLSGPSGSGKTTTAFRLRALLQDMGIKTHALSMDNYFLSVNDPRNEREPDGSIDFESPKRLDIELLNEHLEKLWSGEEFTLPIFDFANQQQLKGKQFQRREHEMVIIEGIHALNPNVTGDISEHASGIYVSVRTRIKSNCKVEGNRIFLHPSKIRLMRRLIRDKLFRNRQAAQTLEFFEKVQIGEEKYIAPHKCYAEHHIDTFLSYEPAVYKRFLSEDLSDLRNSYDGFEKYEDMMVILKELDDVDLDCVPDNSLVREFAGGSVFEY